MSKPPSVEPPPIKRTDQQSEASGLLYWMIAPAVLLGILIAIFCLAWPVDRPIVGQGNDATNGGGQNRIANFDSDTGAPTGIASGNDKVLEPQPEHDSSKKVTPPPFSTDTSSEDGEDVTTKRQVVVLSIVEEKSTSKTSRTDSKGVSLATGGVNPFVGTGTSAKTTIYVIDVSGSMQTPDRLPRVISSLKRAVDLLKPEQKFTVILFDQIFYIAPVGQGLVQATNRNKQAIFDWLDNAPGGSGTNPLPAMLTAIQQKPERIVLLSDGEFDPTSAFAITQANRSNVRSATIDCVGLMEEVETLMEIAKANKGIYYQAQ